MVGGGFPIPVTDSAKNKWFDSKAKRRAKIPIPRPFGLRSEASEEQCLALLEAMRAAKVKTTTLVQFENLAGMPPVCRLGRNLKVLLSRMMERPIVDFMRDALLPHELEALIGLASMASEHQEVAQSLLNIDERYQLAQAAKGMFDLERRQESG